MSTRVWQAQVSTCSISTFALCISSQVAGITLHINQFESSFCGLCHWKIWALAVLAWKQKESQAPSYSSILLCKWISMNIGKVIHISWKLWWPFSLELAAGACEFEDAYSCWSMFSLWISAAVSAMAVSAMRAYNSSCPTAVHGATNKTFPECDFVFTKAMSSLERYGSCSADIGHSWVHARWKDCHHAAQTRGEFCLDEYSHTRSQLVHWSDQILSWFVKRRGDEILNYACQSCWSTLVILTV